MLPDRELVHEALAALYDNVALAKARLAECFEGVRSKAAMDERAAALRSLLLEGIDSLRPPRRLPFGSPEARAYDVLRLRYLERLTISQIEEELSLGRRQVFRDLREGERRLAEVLASWAQQEQGTAIAPSREELLSDELLAMASTPAMVDLLPVLAEALELVSPLAGAAGVQLVLPADARPATVLADRVLLKQLLVQLLCCAVQSAASAQPPLVRIECRGEPLLVLRFSGRLSAAQERRLADAIRVAATQGLVCFLESSPAGESELRLERGQRRPALVLVVEDNPGAVELYRRYLPAGEWYVQATSEPATACEVACRLQPDVIVLDIMMPQLDGWALLRRLREQEPLRDIPIVICSVLEQPELGKALGAAHYLTKPVSRGQFLAALRSCLHRNAAQETEPPGRKPPAPSP